jgi:MoaA/NifB/PqqE/SkfB family radical SAM enzyme
MTIASSERADYGPRRLTVELVNFCNLHCRYCLRDDGALHHDAPVMIPVERLQAIARDARDVMGVTHLMFTGGEPTLHREFGRILAAVAELSLTCSFVTNGWHFERVWPLIVDAWDTVTHVAFSLDGATRDAHDRWRSRGSFDRVVQAFSRCWANELPFHVKVGLRRDTVPELERLATFAARLGAASLSFAHLMPTSVAEADASALTLEERDAAEREIAHLARILKMPVTIDVGYYNVSAEAPCSPLAGVSGNVDYRGRLTLCCNLSGFRAGRGEPDVVGDLATEAFAPVYERFQRLAEAQAARRRDALAACGSQPAGLATGSPCLFCLNTLGKTPWTALAPARPAAGGAAMSGA